MLSSTSSKFSVVVGPDDERLPSFEFVARRFLFFLENDLQISLPKAAAKKVLFGFWKQQGHLCFFLTLPSQLPSTIISTILNLSLANS